MPKDKQDSAGGSCTINLIAELSMKRKSIDDFKDIRRHQDDDKLLQSWKAKPPSNLKLKNGNGVMIVQNGSERAWKLYVPRSLVRSTIQSTDGQLGHAGASKVYMRTSRSFSFGVGCGET